MPDGDDVRVPPPEPVLVTVSAYAARVKVAVTARAASRVKTQLLVPVHAPLQPPKSERLSGVAVSETTVPDAKLGEHVSPQSTPAGAEVTVPAPVPLFDTVSA